MALVTVGRIRAVYAMLCAFPPFARWPMPPPAAVLFRVSDDLGLHGCYDRTEAGRHRIAINRHTVQSLHMLIETVAHEMAHLRQDMTGRRPATRAEQHNREFYRLARLICRDLGFDPARF